MMAVPKTVEVEYTIEAFTAKLFTLLVITL